MAKHHHMGVPRTRVKRQKIVKKKTKPSQKENDLSRNAKSTELVSSQPRDERHRKGAFYIRDFHRREVLLACMVFLVDHAAKAQAEVNLRTTLGIGPHIPPGGPKHSFKSQKGNKTSKASYGPSAAADIEFALSVRAPQSGLPKIGQLATGIKPEQLENKNQVAALEKVVSPERVVRSANNPQGHHHKHNHHHVQKPDLLDSFSKLHQYNQTSQLTSNAVSFMPTRRIVGELILEANGIDPNKRVEVRDIYISGETTAPGAARSTMTQTKPFIDVFLEDQIVKVPFVSHRGPELLQDLPDLDHVFNLNFDAHVESTKIFGTQEVIKKLSEFGIDRTKNATIMSVRVYINDHPSHPIGAGRHHHEGHLGHILRVTSEGETDDFAILPHHPDMVIRIPKHPTAHAHWLAKWIENRKDLFFKSDTDLRSAIRYTATILEDNINVSEAAGKIINLIFDHSFGILKKVAYEDTEIDNFINMMRGLIFPGYDFGAALKQGDYAMAVFYLGLEIVPYVSPAGKKLVKLVNKARNRLDKLRGITKIDNLGEGIADQVGSVAQDTSRLNVQSLASEPETGHLSRQQPAPETGQLPKQQPAADTGQLARQQPIEADDPLESIRSFHDRPARLSAEGQGKLQTLKNLIERDSRSQQFIGNSNLSVESRINYITHLLGRNGYETKIRGVLIWKSLKTDLGGNLPSQHFVVLAKKGDNGAEYAVDIMAGRFDDSLGLNNNIIDLEEQWARLFYHGRRSYLPDGIIKYRDFDNFRDARSMFDAWRTAMPVSDLGRGISILGGPRKYIDALKYAQKNPAIRNHGRRSRFKKYFVELRSDLASIGFDQGKVANGIRSAVPGGAAGAGGQAAKTGAKTGAKGAKVVDAVRDGAQTRNETRT